MSQWAELQERENESKLVTMSSPNPAETQERFLQNSKAKIFDEKLMLPVASDMSNSSTCTFNYYFIHYLLYSAQSLCTCMYLTLL